MSDKWMRRAIDIILLHIVHFILVNLNVWRCMHISRQDNNRLYYFGENVPYIIKRIKNKYEEIEPPRFTPADLNGKGTEEENRVSHEEKN